MAFFLGVLAFIVAVTLSVAVHELGHLLTAKRYGVRVPEYMIGFGPKLWSRKRGETDYGFKAFPLGGYCRLMGMVPPADEVKPLRVTGWLRRLIEDSREANVQEIIEGDEHRSFYRLVWWKRVVVMLGGIGANLVLATLIFTGIGLFYGAPQNVPAVGAIVECVLPYDADRECADTDPETAAALGGFEAGDRILAVDGEDVDTWDALIERVQARAGEEVDFTVLRDDKEFVLSATPTAVERPVRDEDGNAMIGRDGEPVLKVVGFLGVSPAQEIVPQGPFYGIAYTGELLGLIGSSVLNLPELLWDTGRAAFGFEERDQDGIMSILGAGRIAGEITAVDIDGVTFADRIAGLFGLIAGINLALAVFNMIPLPPLDGGHAVGAIWEGAKNGWARMRNRPKPGPVDVARGIPLTYVVVVLLILMGVLLVYADIVAPISIT